MKFLEYIYSIYIKNISIHQGLKLDTKIKKKNVL